MIPRFSVSKVLSEIAQEETRLGKKVACPLGEALYRKILETTAQLLMDPYSREQGFEKIPFVCLVNFLYRNFEVFAQWKSFVDELKRILSSAEVQDLPGSIDVEMDGWIGTHIRETPSLFGLVANSPNYGKSGWITEFCRVLASRPKKSETKFFRSLVEKIVRWLWGSNQTPTMGTIKSYCKSQLICPKDELGTDSDEAAIEMLLNAVLDVRSALSLVDRDPSLLKSEQLAADIASSIGVLLRNYFVDDSSFVSLYEDLRFPRELDPAHFVDRLRRGESAEIVTPDNTHIESNSLEYDDVVLGEYQVVSRGFSCKVSVVPDIGIGLETLEEMLRNREHFGERVESESVRWIFIASNLDEARVEIVTGSEQLPQELEYLRTTKLDSRSFRKWIHCGQTHLVCVHHAHPGVFRIWFRSTWHHSILKALVPYPNPPTLALGKKYELCLRVGAIGWTDLDVVTFRIQSADHIEEILVTCQGEYVERLIDLHNFLTSPGPELAVTVKALGKELTSLVRIPPVFLISTKVDQLVAPTGDSGKDVCFRDKYVLFVHNSIADAIRSSTTLEIMGSFGMYDFYIPVWDGSTPLEIEYGGMKWVLKPTIEIQLDIESPTGVSNDLSRTWNSAESEIQVVDKSARDLYVLARAVNPGANPTVIQMKRRGVLIFQHVTSLTSENTRIRLCNPADVETGAYELIAIVKDQITTAKVVISPEVTFTSIPRIAASDKLRIPFQSSHRPLGRAALSQEMELSAQQVNNNLTEYRGRVAFAVDDIVVLLEARLLVHTFDIYWNDPELTGMSVPRAPVKVSFAGKQISTVSGADGSFRFRIERSSLAHDREEILVESEGIRRTLFVTNPPSLRKLYAPFRDCVVGETIHVCLEADAVERTEANVKLSSVSHQEVQAIRLPFRGDLHLTPKHPDSTYSAEVSCKGVFLGGLNGISVHHSRRILLWLDGSRQVELPDEEAAARRIREAQPGSTMILGFSSPDQLTDVTRLLRSEFRIYASEDAILCGRVDFAEPLQLARPLDVERAVVLLSSTALDEEGLVKEHLERIRKARTVAILAPVSVFQSITEELRKATPIIDILNVPFKETVKAEPFYLRLKVSHAVRGQLRLVCADTMGESFEESIPIPCDGNYRIPANREGTFSIVVYHGTEALRTISDLRVDGAKSIKCWDGGLHEFAGSKDLKAFVETNSPRHTVIGVPSVDTLVDLMQTLCDQKELPTLLTSLLDDSWSRTCSGLTEVFAFADLSEKTLRRLLSDLNRNMLIMCPNRIFEHIVAVLERIRASSSSEEPRIVITRSVRPSRTTVGAPALVECTVSSLRGDAFRMKVSPESMMIPAMKLDPREGTLYTDHLREGDSMVCSFHAVFQSEGRMELPPLEAAFEDAYGKGRRSFGRIDYVDVVPQELLDHHDVELHIGRGRIKMPPSDAADLEVYLVNASAERLSRVTLRAEPSETVVEAQGLRMDTLDAFTSARFPLRIRSPSQEGTHLVHLTCNYDTTLAELPDCGLTHSKMLQVQVVVVSPHLSGTRLLPTEMVFGRRITITLSIKNESDVGLSDVVVSEKVSFDRPTSASSHDFPLKSIAPFESASITYEIIIEQVGPVVFDSHVRALDEFDRPYTARLVTSETQVNAPSFSVSVAELVRVLKEEMIPLGHGSSSMLHIKVRTNADRLDRVKMTLRSERGSFEIINRTRTLNLFGSPVEVDVEAKGLRLLYRRSDIAGGLIVKESNDSLICRLSHRRSGCSFTQRFPVAIFPSVRCVKCPFPTCKKTRYDPNTCPTG
jgi:hypothetical protein